MKDGTKRLRKLMEEYDFPLEAIDDILTALAGIFLVVGNLPMIMYGRRFVTLRTQLSLAKQHERRKLNDYFNCSSKHNCDDDQSV